EGVRRHRHTLRSPSRRPHGTSAAGARMAAIIPQTSVSETKLAAVGGYDQAQPRQNSSAAEPTTIAAQVDARPKASRGPAEGAAASPTGGPASVAAVKAVPTALTSPTQARSGGDSMQAVVSAAQTSNGSKEAAPAPTP